MHLLGIGALVFALGLRHGLDPDHLVAIDGLTRSSRSRWTGLFFSLGHGLVITLLGVVLSLAATSLRAPQGGRSALSSPAAWWPPTRSTAGGWRAWSARRAPSARVPRAS